MMAKKKNSQTASGQRPKGRVKDVSIHLINETLRGPVVDIFIGNIPGLNGLDREQAYDLIMNNPELADCCFKLFRKNPELFSKLLVDAKRNSVSAEDQPLRCGRSTQQVVALIVRAIAKRHFRSKLTPRKVVRAPVKRSLWKRFVALFFTPAPPPRRKRKATRADSLYQALHDHLLYEWQVSLIPHYVPLPVPLVRQLGARILEYREPAQLRDLALSGLPVITAPPTAVPQGAAVDEPLPDMAAQAAPVRVLSGALPGRSGAMPAGGRQAISASSKAEAMWTVSQAMDLPLIFALDEGGMRDVIAHISAIGTLTMSALNNAGMKLPEAVALLVALDQLLGHSRFRALLGNDADPAFLKVLSAALKALGIVNLRDPLDIREGAVRLLDDLRAAGHLRS